ncbi:Hypothetical protein NTJ_06803 [Nesidiocoris tenuis]|uniref:Protein TsetseEP domain-containing protein n=1 Tax=Nesidiocoris tenuis TaxID=355587 RepID=A0ABN7ARB0_9HEMI|nr:Hypothetical protein NTJ_06803 [Nesidiocoris tenuis]
MIMKLIFAIILIHSAVGDRFGASNPLSTLKSRVDRVMNNLDSLKREVRLNLDRQVYNVKINNMESVNKAVNPAMDRISNKVNEAKKQGRNVDHCLEEARVALRSYSTNAFDQLNKCDKAAHSRVESTISSVETPLTQAASQIKNAADQVALSCVGSSGIMGYEICVNRNMVPVANSVGNLETTYRTVEETIRSTSRSAITESYSCLSNAVSSIFKSTSQVESTANNCVKA